MKKFFLIIVLFSFSLNSFSYAQQQGVNQVAIKTDRSFNWTTAALAGAATYFATQAAGYCSSIVAASACVITLGYLAGTLDQKEKTRLINNNVQATSCASSAQGCNPNGFPSSGDPQIDGIINSGVADFPAAKMDAKTGKIYDKKNNKAYSVSDFASPQAMAAAGFSKSSIDQAMAMAKAAEGKAAESSLANQNNGGGYEEGGGGHGGGSTTIAIEEDASALGPSGASGLGGNDKNDELTRGVAGLSKNYHGNPIGVAADDIFKMMARRYQLKEKQDTFFGFLESIQK